MTMLTTSLLKDNRLYLAVAYLLIIIKILGKMPDALQRCDWLAFHNPALVNALVIVIIFNAILFYIARNISMIIRVPASFIFLILPFLFYLALLINNLIIHVNDLVVLYALITLFLMYAVVSGRKQLKEKIEKGKTEFDILGYLLIAVLITHGFMLFLGHNFNINRVPFADENSFWYVASKSIIEDGFTYAHQRGYPGGGLHPLGVPFISALPAMLGHFTSPVILFFMPIYVLTGFVMILIELVNQRLKWAVIFFVIAWFASFNNRSWSGGLFYTMIYGESVSMVLVLSLLNWLIASNSGSTSRPWWLPAFLIGLLTLTKFPLILLSIVFFAAFVMKNWNAIRNYRRLLLMFALFLLPFTILKAFQIQYGGALAGLRPDICLIIRRFLSPNIDMLHRVVSNTVMDADNLWYYFLISIVFSMFCYQQWRNGWPIGTWVLFLFIYYAYINSYGLIGGGDAASGLRYLLPAVAGLFFLGAYGFAGLMNHVKRLDNMWVRYVLSTLLLVTIFYKLF